MGCLATLNGGEWNQPYLTVRLIFARLYRGEGKSRARGG